MFTRPGILFVLLSQAWLAASARADIVGGDDVKESDSIRASTVGLYSPSPDGRGGSLCTASIISNDIAVTAAHCISPGRSRPVVLFGRDLHSPQTIAEPVVGAKASPEWGRRGGRGMDQGDIALVRFKGGLPPGYRKTGMARSDSILGKGTSVVLAGYGISDARARSGSGTLRKTSVRILDSRAGRPEMILNQSHGRGACHGDSGGPAMVQYRGRPVLAGVTNRSYPDSAPDDCAHHVVYTKVSAYRDWIRKTEKQLRATHASPFKARMRRPRHERVALNPVRSGKSRLRHNARRRSWAVNPPAQ